MPLQSPVLFLIFNRPELTERVFEAIRQAQPARLYVAADGPRANRPGEDAVCHQTRMVTDRIDWECQVQRLYRNQNLGCGPGVSEAITWFFEHEPEGIILEDDCLPSRSFWGFCQTMLDRFRSDDRIASVSGDFFFPPVLRHSQPYIFSKYVQIWGWATWRRVWKQYDYHLTGSEEEWAAIIRQHNPLDLESRYWREVLRYMKRGLIDTWDFQVMFSCWKRNQLHVAPTRNLVENLGYGRDATHTVFESPMAELKAEEITTELPCLPLEVDPQLELGTFVYRFLDGLHNTWILHQAIDVTEKLSWARWELERAKKMPPACAAVP
jgi:hypothetical protein